MQTKGSTRRTRMRVDVQAWEHLLCAWRGRTESTPRPRSQSRGLGCIHKSTVKSNDWKWPGQSRTRKCQRPPLSRLNLRAHARGPFLQETLSGKELQWQSTRECTVGDPKSSRNSHIRGS